MGANVMAWNVDMLTMLRDIIDDYDTPYKYTDDRLLKLLLTSAQFVQQENVMLQTYAIDFTAVTLTPDPTNTAGGTREDAFINLTLLRAACLLASAVLRKTGGKSFKVVEGPSSIDMTDNIVGAKNWVQNACQAYKDAQWSYELHGRVDGVGILGPFRQGIGNYGYGYGGCGGYPFI
jgi:hypothetical protein